MAAASHTEVFNCSVPEFYKLVTDYEKYPQFLQEVKDCRVLKQDGARKLVEYKVVVMKTFTYQLWTTEKEPTDVNWTFAGGDVFKTTNGSWKLEDQAGCCKATYSVEATFSMFVPGPIAKTLLSVNLPSMMSSYHKRVKDVYGK
jgi:ribosome-associated toxin RatA of RatAB toxin-antitoxin module